jgi:hypothetical protein
MPGLPQARRRVAGVSTFAILVVLAVLWALRKIEPRSPLDGRQQEIPAEGQKE